MNTNLAMINTSKIQGYKNAFYAVSLILIFAISIGMAFAPTASAQVVVIISIAHNQRLHQRRATTYRGWPTLTVNLWVLPIPEDYAIIVQRTNMAITGVT